MKNSWDTPKPVVGFNTVHDVEHVQPPDAVDEPVPEAGRQHADALRVEGLRVDAPREEMDEEVHEVRVVRRDFDRVRDLCGIPTDSRYLQLECSGTNFWRLSL